MTRHPTSSIALDRQFLPVPNSGADGYSDGWTRRALAWGQGETWPQLLEHPYVVVLGEAGTGKTTEFRQQVAELRRLGKLAVFIEIGDLASDGLEASLDADAELRLAEWRDTNAPGFLFLDSLDEAKLRNQTLTKALRRLQKELHEEWSRCRLVVSCRASDWMATSDRADIDAAIPTDVETKVHVVQLAPLIRSQVEKLAAHSGVVDVASFVSAIDDHFAWDFVERPLDVEWLGSYWIQNEGIGSLRTLIPHNIEQKLKEVPSRPTLHSPANARAGVQALSGFASLKGHRSFLVPDETLDVLRSSGGVDPLGILADWTPGQIQDLLRRPIFDESTYGRVRIHHRSVQEFLTAEWLKELCGAGMAHKKLEALVFREWDGESVVPRQFEAVAAWLSLWDEKLRERLIEEAPAILIGEGDPSGFCAGDRQRILRAYARRYSNRVQRFPDLDRASLRRFSSPALAIPIAELLGDAELPEELAVFLLELVEQGRITECSECARDLALDAQTTSWVRIYAIRAAAAAGTSAIQASLLQLVETTDSWDQELAGVFIRALFPEPLGAAGLIRILSRVQPEPKNAITSLKGALEIEVPKRGSVEAREVLLSGLIELIRGGSVGEKEAIPAETFWLLPALGALLAGILDDLPGSLGGSEEVLAGLELLLEGDKNGVELWEVGERVKTELAKHPWVRRDLFWRSAARYGREEGVFPTRHLEIHSFSDIDALSKADGEWLSQDAMGRPFVREQLLAFDALFYLPRTEAEQAGRLAQLKRIAASSEALSKRLHRLMHRTPTSRPSQRIWERKSRARELARQRGSESNRRWLKENIKALSSGSEFNALWYLVKNGERGLLGLGDPTSAPIREKFGDEIADAARQGCRAFWRTYDPPLRHERKKPNSIPGEVAVGLFGIHFDFEDGLEPSSLDEDLVRIAARYAACVLNNFPQWFLDLAQVNSTVVVSALEPAIVAAFGHPETTETVLDILTTIAAADSGTRQLFEPVVAGLLGTGDPPRVKALVNALATLLRSEGAGVELVEELAEARCQSAIEDPHRFAVWWCCWLERDPGAALDFLERTLEGLANSGACHLVEQICHQLHEWKEDFFGIPLSVLSSAQALEGLILIVWEYITFETDIEHEEAYTPGPRDHAQEIRSLLVGWLVSVPGEESVEALRRLSRHPLLATRRDWFLKRADERVVLEASLSIPEEVAFLETLYRKHGLDALNHLDFLGEEAAMTFDVCIITMKEEEHKALLEKLEPTSTFKGTNRDYDIAEVETLRGSCRVALTRVSRQGNTAAQNAANELIQDLEPRFVLVVGIAGGVPTTDFCLGDVVVSSEVIDLSLEDTGTGVGASRFDASGGPLLPAATRVTDRLRSLERDTSDSWSEEPSIDLPRPDVVGTFTTDDEVWNQKVTEALDKLKSRLPPKPVATARKTASSDRLVKSPDLVTKWQSVLKGIAAVEMESAGVYLACQRGGVPFLAVRGISDIVGWKRNDAWTEYACHTAAAYTRMLIQSGAFSP